MNIVFHQGLTAEKWQRFSLLEQMANIGSEVGRAINWRNKGNPVQAEAALFRGLELFDLTREDPKNLRRLREVGRAREAFLDFFSGDNQYGFTGEAWQKYFTDFAIAARHNH
ncbi:MAG: hypothetical protein Q8O53_02185 [Candidatus Moranbacteria bacterium]|nr:hypothetical protein [Candidatus Moranbacteria bacterium]